MIKRLAEPRKEKKRKDFWNFSTSSGWSRVPRWAWPREEREREWSTPSNTRGDSTVSQQGAGSWGGWGGVPGPITQQLQSNPSPVAASASSNPRAESLPLPRPRKHPTSLCSQCHRLRDGDGGAESAGVSVIPGGRSQGAESSPPLASAPPS